MQRFTDLNVWRRGHALALAVYEASRIESLLMLSRDLGYLGQSKTTPLLEEAQEVACMLCALRRTVERATVNSQL